MIKFFSFSYRITSRVKYEFHVSLFARKKYDLNESLFSITGDLIISNFRLARELAQKINQKKEEEQIFDQYTTAGQVNAIGLLHEIFHFVIRYYEEKENPGVLAKSIKYLRSKLGNEDLEEILYKFVENFPPIPLQKGKMTVNEYLKRSTEGKSNKEIIIEELILLHLENINYPFRALKELFNDKILIDGTAYKTFLIETEKFFEKEKPFSLEGTSLITALKKPILLNLNSIVGQLDYIRKVWGIIVNEKFLQRLLSGTDLIREDAKLFVPHGEIGTPPVPEYIKLSKEELERLSPEDTIKRYHYEYEHFTKDIDWMSSVVMIAKNIYVWLDQLSKKYQREIKRLDQIPDEELDHLASWNFNALWLIGIWERCNASKKIKQFCGNPEAASSAYSLFDYDIANELGGEEAFQNLKYRCIIRGIRLASDMVPNHTGIFSRWILENPDYFIQSSYPPFPQYNFSGPDLSDDRRIQIRIEDRYYSKHDAAVVFQLVENNTGRVRYIYHGNDGTNMPWNDTAQLNLLNPEAREALIQKIMHVARKTQIIRFDAAMTLSKLHYSRLWFPAPGTGGAIPSRSEYAMHPDEFNRLMPKEFWREVVDRINAEMPETLLLAEAFWLMEGYFVRTLGMHRVYNSAFMHMFMKEENHNYRKLIKNTIEFNPEILKRYVNFMSNPDEETAVNQFGKGDKYFGICIMMITLPGLPMFAHGQIEGFTEKYGMEYKRAYYNEYPDEYLIRRHEEEIFPLIHKRYLFSQVTDFELYDFINDRGHVNENVFAFSNMHFDEKALVFYNNSYEQTSGRIKFTSGKVVSFDENGQPRDVKNKSLGDALKLKYGNEFYYVFKEYKTKLEYIRPAKEIFEEGIWVHLNGYEYQIYLDFREIVDFKGEYGRLCYYLNGKGVPSIQEALLELNLLPLHSAVSELFSRDNIIELKNFAGFEGKKVKENKLSAYVKTKLNSTISELKSYNRVLINENEIIKKVEEDLILLRELNKFVDKKNENINSKTYKQLKERLIFNDLQKGEAYEDLFIIYVVIRRILLGLNYAIKESDATTLYNSLLLHKPIWQSLLRLGDNYATVKLELDLLEILASTESIFPYRGVVKTDNLKETAATLKAGKTIYKFPPILKFLSIEEVRNFIGYNVFKETKYYSKENFELLLNWNFTFELIRQTKGLIKSKIKEGLDIEEVYTSVFYSKEFSSLVIGLLKYIEEIVQLSNEAEFKFDQLIEKWITHNSIKSRL
jgi:glycosidase